MASNFHDTSSDDELDGQKGYGEKIIKDCLEEIDRIIEERQKKKRDQSR